MKRSPRRRVGALLTLCRILGGRSPAPADAAEWDDVVDVARELWVLPSLGYAVRDARPGPPAPTAEMLADYHRVNALRNARFRRQLIEAVRALNDAAITPLLFKGALQLVNGTEVSHGYRGMGDLDLAVPPGSLTAAAEALEEAGYRPDRKWVLLHPHVLPMTSADVPGPIELHTALGTPRVAAALPADAAWATAGELSFDGVRARALSPTHQILHSVLHASVQDLGHRVGALPLRQLLTLAQLERAHGAAVDWPEVRARMGSGGLARVLRDHLWLGHRLAGLALPEGRWPTSGARVHEARVLANFGLGWPAYVHRNLLDAFDRNYLDALYKHGDRPLSLAHAWGRHAAHLIRREGLGVATKGVERRV